MEKIDVTEALKELKPRTKFGEFESLWPEIREALDNKITRYMIWENLHQKGILEVHYATFARWVIRKMETEGEHSKAASQPNAEGEQPIKETTEQTNTVEKEEKPTQVKRPDKNPITDAKGFVYGREIDKNDLY